MYPHMLVWSCSLCVYSQICNWVHKFSLSNQKCAVVCTHCIFIIIQVYWHVLEAVLKNVKVYIHDICTFMCRFVHMLCIYTHKCVHTHSVHALTSMQKCLFVYLQVYMYAPMLCETIFIYKLVCTHDKCTCMPLYSVRVHSHINWCAHMLFECTHRCRCVHTLCIYS